MTRILSAVVGALLALPAGLAWAGAPDAAFGTWQTEDGRARIRTERCGAANDRLCGYVVWLKATTNEDGSPKKDPYNPDPKKHDRPALGIQLLHGLKLNSDGRFAGQIYNADNGKSYDVSIWSDGAQELSVRGCLVSVLCKTQGWARATDVIPGQLAGLTGAANGPRPDAGYGRSLQVTGSLSGAKAGRKPAAAAPVEAPAEPPAAE